MPRQTALARRLYAVPVLGWIARDIAKSTDNIWYALVIVLTAVILATLAWGVKALAMTGLLLVPVMFVILILITFG